MDSPAHDSPPPGGQHNPLTVFPAPGGPASLWPQKLRRRKARLARAFTHSQLSYWIYRYRFLAMFTNIGAASILVEILLVRQAFPDAMPWPAKACAAFVIGMLFSFVLNAWLNFRVSRRYLLRTLWRFALVSTFSFSLNVALMNFFNAPVGDTYGTARLATAGVLFFVAYRMHRRYTFDQTRNLGIAVYASASERVLRIFHRVGRTCNHVHVDLVDTTMNPQAEPVDLNQLHRVRRLWRKTPVCLHVMSLFPSQWVDKTWDAVDWYLFHCNAREDLAPLIVACRLRRKRVGIVWHTSDDFSLMLSLLPHVDFVMVLGVAQPGFSGQPIVDEAVRAAEMLDRMRKRYHYEVMFDGGVNAHTITRIRAKYVVAASAVLKAARPIRSSHCLQTGAAYESRVA